MQGLAGSGLGAWSKRPEGGPKVRAGLGDAGVTLAWACGLGGPGRTSVGRHGPLPPRVCSGDKEQSEPDR